MAVRNECNMSCEEAFGSGMDNLWGRDCPVHCPVPGNRKDHASSLFAAPFPVLGRARRTVPLARLARRTVPVDARG